MKKKLVFPRAIIIFIFLFFINCATIHNNTGWRSGLEEEGKRISQFLAATRQYPGNPDAHYWLACHYQESGKHKEAIEEFKKVLLIDPKYAKAYNGLGVSFDLLGDFPRAVEAYKIALQLNPDLDYVYNNLGYSYLLQGNYNEAINNLKKAISLNTREKKFRQNLGLAYAHKGEYDLALSEFKMANNEANAHYYLAQIYFERGLYEQAKKHYAIAFSLNPSQTIYRTTLNATDSLARIFGQPDNKANQEQLITPAHTMIASEETKFVRVSEQNIDRKGRIEKGFSPANLDNGQMKSEEMNPSVKIFKIETDNKELLIFARWKDIKSKESSEPEILNKSADNKKDLKKDFVSLRNGRVEISNGNGVNRMAKKVGDYLKEKGFKVTHFTNAENFRHLKTKIIYEKNYIEDAKKIAAHIPVNSIKEEAEKFNYPSVKVKVIIGKDLIPYLKKFENNKKS